MNVRINLLMKTCPRCGTAYPRDLRYFGKDGSHSTGMRRECRSCASKRTHEYRVAHLEQCKQKERDHDRRRAEERKEYRASRSEENRAYQRAYHEAHREQRRRRRQERHDEIAENNRRYRAANRERIAAYYRQWCKDHPDLLLQHSRTRRARKLGSAGTHTPADVAAQKARQKDRCYYCHRKLTDYHVDHVVPLALGGSNGPENIVVSCPTCNLSKGAKHPADFAGVMF